MKKVFFVVLLSFSLLLAGCVNLLNPETPEEKAIKLADEVPEIKLISRMVNSMADIDKCTVEKFVAGYKKIAEKQGQELPDLTEEQEAEMKKMIDGAGEWSAKCKPWLSKSAKKESETIYYVSYEFETTAGIDECSIASSEEIKVKVDLLEEKTVLEESFTTMNEENKRQFEEILNLMGDCSGILFYSSAAPGSQSVSTASTPS